MKSYRELLQAITPDIYVRMKQALELGRWPDGRALTEAQRENCMQAVISYERLHIAEQDRVGYIERPAGKQGDSCHDEQPQTLTWKE